MSLLIGLLGAGVGFALGRMAARPRSPQVPVQVGARHTDVIDIIDTMDDGVVACDSDFTVKYLNPSARTMLASGPDLVGRSMDTNALGAQLVHLRPADGGAQASMELGVAQGRWVVARVQARQDGSLVYTLHDVTDLRQIDKVRRDFVANVSHELRTPVSVIRANTETLLDGALEDVEVARDFVEAVHRNAERISNLVSDLLDLARIEAGTVELQAETIGVRDGVEKVLNFVQPVAASRQITIINELPPDLLCQADAGAFEQVLTNLIENAVKYGQESGHVWVRGYPVVGRVRIEVIDDGVGVPSLHRSRLFERFYRVDKGRSRSVGGTGLGLAIVKHLVNGMGGDVGMEANRPTGSVFWVTLPNKK